MPPRDEPPLHNVADDEALGSDTESIPDLAPADDPAPVQENDDLTSVHGDPPGDNLTDSEATVSDNEASDNTSLMQ